MKKNSKIEYYLCQLAKALSLVIRFVPIGFSILIGRAIGALAYYFLRKKRRIAYKNLKIAFPDYSRRKINKIVRQTFMNSIQHIVELLYLPWMDRKYIEKHIELVGLDKVLEVAENKKGLILLGLHEGSWEVASVALSQVLDKYNYTILARDQGGIPALNELLNQYRSKRNCKVITLTDNFRPLIENLKNGFALGMAADHGGQEGIAVNFFSKPALTPTGAIKLALKLNTNLAVGFIRRKGLTRHQIFLSIHKLIKTQNVDEDMKENLEAINRKYEEYIRKDPAEYLWFFKRWKYSPSRDILVLSDGKTGHLKQSLAVLDLIKSLPFQVKSNIVEVKFNSVWRRALFQICGFFFSNNCQGCMSCLRYLIDAKTAKSLCSNYYDAVISSGSSLAMVNRLIAYENLAKSIIVMKPGMFSLKRFDLAIIPEHDNVPKLDNVVLIKGALSRPVDKEDARIKSVVDNFGLSKPPLSQPVVGVLLGGESKYLTLDMETVESLIDSLDEIMDKLGGSILVSTSRRTTKEVGELLKSRLSKKKNCRLLIIANERNPQGSLEAMLCLSDIIIVSADSISMISEAVNSKKYTVVLKLRKKNSGYISKHERFTSDLEKDGYAYSCDNGIFDKVSDIWKRKPSIKELSEDKIIINKLEKIL